ncbi:MAG: hypothetical protein ACYC6R_17675 [Anaerolineales bacterium]
MIAVSPKLGEFLTKATQTPDLETAFWRIFNEYVAMKMAALREANKDYERKWGMTFDEFARQSRENTLKEDAYSWDVEQDFWGWEQTVTLLRHYESLAV